MTTVDFWYEFASTYSYPAAMRVEEAAASTGVAVRWRPFLLGPIFAAQGRWLSALSSLARSFWKVPRLTVQLERFWREERLTQAQLRARMSEPQQLHA